MVRMKHRYMVVEINAQGKPLHAPFNVSSFSLYEAILDKVQQLHGDYGVALVRTGFLAKYCNQVTRIALLKVRHASYRILASTVPFVNKLNERSVTLNTLYVGATMKQCFKFIKNYQTERLNQDWANLKTSAEREAFQAAVMDLKLPSESK